MTITKQAAFSLLEGLTETFCGCDCLCNFSNEHKHFTQRRCDHCDENANRIVFIGDVLEKIKEMVAREFDGDAGIFVDKWMKLIPRWGKLGFHKSLRDILEGAQFEEKFVKLSKLYPERRGECSCKRSAPCPFCGAGEYVEVLKDEKVEALVEFLINLQLVK